MCVYFTCKGFLEKNHLWCMSLSAMYRMIITKVTISKIDNFKITRPNDLIFWQNNHEAMEFCLAKEKK